MCRHRLVRDHPSHAINYGIVGIDQSVRQRLRGSASHSLQTKAPRRWELVGKGLPYWLMGLITRQRLFLHLTTTVGGDVLGATLPLSIILRSIRIHPFGATGKRG